ncbi:MAG: ABC transporter substrate-binding protein [Chloroflexi bacterium]|nr:ABC transporter substrate-binding protein [Chloroflexota bacterium]
MDQPFVHDSPVLSRRSPAAPSPAAPTSAAAKPAATTAPAQAAATSAPAQAAATSAPAAAAKPTAAPAAAGQEKLGSQLIGKLEGPEIMVSAGRPAKLAEAPILAELVKQGKLPPVEQRVPDEPLVIKPLQGTGRFGGTLHRAFTGPGDNENGNRWVSMDKPIFWDYTGTKQIPAVAKSWEFADGNRSLLLHLRKGHKWSDGEPFNADDFVFWYQDIYSNKDLVPTPFPPFSVNGKPGRLDKVDDTTVALRFEDPYPLVLTIMGGTTAIGNGLGTGGLFYQCLYAPAHYLKQFLPKYGAQDALDKQAKDLGLPNWQTLFQTRYQHYLNPDLPMLGPWHTTVAANTPVWVLERNPFCYMVDTDGNQLPYIDKIQMDLGENLEVINLRAIAGQYDMQERHTALDKTPVFLDNLDKGNYKLHLDPALNGSDATLQTNQSFDADPELAKLLKNRDFRRALSMGIDRDQLNETFWLGVGTPGNVSPSEESPYSPGKEWRTKWATLDVAQANSLLDKMGLDKKGADGVRLRADGKPVVLEMMTTAGSFIPQARIGEAIGQQWKKIGIGVNVIELERNLSMSRMRNNEHQIYMWANDGSEILYTFPIHAIPVDPTQAMMGPKYAQWFASGGEQGVMPDDPQMLKIYDLFKSAAGQDTQASIQTAQQIWQILVDEAYSIGTVGLSPATQGIRVVKNTMGNVPEREINAQHCRTPCSSQPATFFFKA